MPRPSTCQLSQGHQLLPPVHMSILLSFQRIQKMPLVPNTFPVRKKLKKLPPVLGTLQLHRDQGIRELKPLFTTFPVIRRLPKLPPVLHPFALHPSQEIGQLPSTPLPAIFVRSPVLHQDLKHFGHHALDAGCNMSTRRFMSTRIFCAPAVGRLFLLCRSLPPHLEAFIVRLVVVPSTIRSQVCLPHPGVLEV